jgi:hypothetical protein
VLAEIKTLLCDSIPQPSASGKLAARLVKGTKVSANGWVVVNGHLEYV